MRKRMTHDCGTIGGHELGDFFITGIKNCADDCELHAVLRGCARPARRFRVDDLCVEFTFCRTAAHDPIDSGNHSARTGDEPLAWNGGPIRRSDLAGDDDITNSQRRIDPAGDSRSDDQGKVETLQELTH